MSSVSLRDGRRNQGVAVGPGVTRRSSVLTAISDSEVRRELVEMLRAERFDPLESDSGEAALALFESARPDLVLVAVQMSDMSGHDATRYIKAMAGADFVPVILVCCAHDEESLTRCIQAGGDDFLVWPFSAGLLRTRILAMNRMRGLHRAVFASCAPLTQRLELEHQEQALAERVFSRAIGNRNVVADSLSLEQRAAAMFNGDLVLTQHLPDGGLRMLMGDFTLHGLAATIGALPVAEAFHAMTAKGVSDDEVLEEINLKLHALLPPGRFMSATLISIPSSSQYLYWWNGGMPSAWLRTAEGLYELSSHALPLGVLPKLGDGDVPRKISVRQGDSLLVFTDGLLEASDTAGRRFEEVCLRGVLDDWRHGDRVFPGLIEALDRHCTGADQADDIAVLEIPIETSIFSIPEPVWRKLPFGGWTWSVELRDGRLGAMRSVDSLLRPLGLLDGLDTHVPALETIVAELYSNALEHGISMAPLAVKISPDALASGEFSVSEAANGAPRSGWIRIEIRYLRYADGGAFAVSLSHGGKGFECQGDSDGNCLPPRPWGEGLALLQGLCESLNYSEGGRRADAFYRWRS
ncbi:PP2C family protein-serine/threonine phosphatase [Thiorhodococcus fuscus]|uniref:PP2C family protein-serine/threonine phosphatase n=1 Tax=Thiorhodococcus fuscus TaxID=527200 RepID=A0ABW4Y4C4_9GAMM